MIDHAGFAVRDFATSKAFYAKALAPLFSIPTATTSKR